jgi:hypothetical protein
MFFITYSTGQHDASPQHLLHFVCNYLIVEHHVDPYVEMA